jgi:hypothetical protein
MPHLGHVHAATTLSSGHRRVDHHTSSRRRRTEAAARQRRLAVLVAWLRRVPNRVAPAQTATGPMAHPRPSMTTSPAASRGVMQVVRSDAQQAPSPVGPLTHADA